MVCSYRGWEAHGQVATSGEGCVLPSPTDRKNWKGDGAPRRKKEGEREGGRERTGEVALVCNMPLSWQLIQSCAKEHSRLWIFSRESDLRAKRRQAWNLPPTKILNTHVLNPSEETGIWHSMEGQNTCIFCLIASVIFHLAYVCVKMTQFRFMLFGIPYVFLKVVYILNYEN